MSLPQTTQPRLPTGTVTFLFTDIEGSTRLLAGLGDAYPELLSEHARILREAIMDRGGREVSTEGDSFFAVFKSAVDAVATAADAQRAVARRPWPDRVTVGVRMGLHTGEGRLGGDNYVGLDVHRAARIAAAGHGGQVLLSDATRTLVSHELPAGVAVRDLGEHRLKDLPAPERLWQLEIEGLRSDFPALRSLDARPNNLPISTTPLIGRGRELDTVAALLEHRRLLTLTGPGGAGKTRLALALAQRLLSDFADGAFFVALEDAHDRPTAAAAIASAVGVRETPDRPLEAGVKEFLRDRELLLVLDNFEQIVSAAPLVAELLAGAPRLRVVVTSRAVLHLTGEQDYEVPPLGLPDPRSLPPFTALSQYAAVALFVERASAVKPGFTVTNENAPAVAEICSRLDGLPLAIELAAARVRLLTPQGILDRLERRLPLLTGGGLDVPARQRTLRGAIDWSYELLDEPVRRLFDRLAVFAGGWTIAAAQEVCNPADELGIDVFDGLAALSDGSLIHPTDGAVDEDRFGMLQVIREFAGEKLDGRPDAQGVRRRHAGHVLALAEAAEPELRGPSLRNWQHRLRREQDNLRAALRWALEGGDVETGLRTAGAIWDYWHYWAELREAARWLESLLGLPAAAVRTRGRARALRALAGVLYWQGQEDRSWTLYEEALDIYRQIGDEHEIGEALHNSAWAAVMRRDWAHATQRATEAIEHYQAAGDTVSAQFVEAWLVIEPAMMGVGGDVTTLAGAARQAIEANRQLGRTHDAVDWVGALAMIYRVLGDYTEAARVGREALREWHEIGNLGRIPLSLKILASVELAQGRPKRAVRLGAAAERYNEEIGGELPEALAQLGDPVAETRPLLSAEEHAQGVREGRAMTVDEVVAYALEEAPSAAAVATVER